MADKKEFSRLETFSDGVFAIAITLLVLEIKVPPLDKIHSPAGLWRELVQLWPSYFAFAYSFGAILVLWINHNHIFGLLEKVTRRVMYFNGLHLLTITFIPFPTAVLANYIGTPYMQPAVVFYCGWSVIVNLAILIMSRFMQKPVRLLKPGIDDKTIKKFNISSYVGLLVYVSTTAIAWWFPVTALVLNVSVWILWVSISLIEQKD